MLKFLDEQIERINSKKDPMQQIERIGLLQISISALNDSSKKFVDLAQKQVEQCENPKSTSSSIISQCK